MRSPKRKDVSAEEGEAMEPNKKRLTTKELEELKARLKLSLSYAIRKKKEEEEEEDFMRKFRNRAKNEQGPMEQAREETMKEINGWFDKYSNTAEEFRRPVVNFAVKAIMQGTNPQGKHTEIANVKATLQERFISYKNISDFVMAKIRTELDTHRRQLRYFTLDGVREPTEIVRSIMGSPKLLSVEAVKKLFVELLNKMADANKSLKCEAAKQCYQIKKWKRDHLNRLGEICVKKKTMGKRIEEQENKIKKQEDKIKEQEDKIKKQEDKIRELKEFIAEEHIKTAKKTQLKQPPPPAAPTFCSALSPAAPAFFSALTLAAPAFFSALTPAAPTFFSALTQAEELKQVIPSLRASRACAVCGQLGCSGNNNRARCPFFDSKKSEE